jgi:uncharacterized Zn-finger protein
MSEMFLNNIKSRGWLVLNCLFCGRTSKDKNDMSDNGYKKEIVFTRIMDEGIALCSICEIKFGSLLCYMGKELVEEWVEAYKESNKQTCGYCEKRFWPTNMARWGVGFVCITCYNLPSETKKKMKERR